MRHPAVSHHLYAQLSRRVTDVDLAHTILCRIDLAVATLPRGVDAAVYVYRDTVAHGDTTLPYHDRAESNGEWCVVIIRSGTAVTTMWRRDDQPRNPRAFRVHRVLRHPEA